ncbi:MAG: family 16 glycosylhydrolase [Spirochaetales bacterium]|nr:family 16 glycosylhydrolase [Spirochaetales bacterium]
MKFGKNILLTVLGITLFSCNSSNQVAIENDVDATRDNWTLVWSDEFDSTQIDESKWNFISGAGGYGNSELQNYTGREKNARIENGNLVIEAHKEDYEGSNYTSAKLTTEGKGDWTYGRYEIRAKLPKGQGFWPALWMMPTDYNIYGPWPACGEIDIMEVLGHETNKVYGTLHYGNPKKSSGTNYVLESGSFSDSYHTFTLDWLPGEIKWYIDGVLYQTQNDWYSNNDEAPEALAFPAPFDRDFYLQFNLAVGGTWPGNPNSSTKFPQRLEIDWVRVYELNSPYKLIKKPETEGSNAEIPGRAPQDDGNYVLNDQFNNGLENWTFINNEGGKGSAQVDNGEMYIEMSAPGNQTWANQLFQTDMNIRKGYTYRVSFKARAEKERTIMFKVGGLEDRGWTAYSGEQIIKITKDMKLHSFEFTMGEKTDVKARYEFNMGLDDSDMWIDDVKLEVIALPGDYVKVPNHLPLKYGNLIYNGTFDKGSDRKAFWNIQLDSKSDAMFMVTPDLYKREAKIVTLDSSNSNDAIILYQENIGLINGESYKIKFDAYAGNNRKISVGLFDENWKNIGEKINLDLENSSKKYSYEFSPSTKDYDNVKVAFVLVDKDSTDTVYIDNVTFSKLVKPKKIVGLTHLEAEDFFSKSDVPQTQECVEGGLNVGWMTEGNWLKYKVITTASGTYKINLRVASATKNNPLVIKTELGSAEIEYKGSGDWQNWETISNEIELPSGESEIIISAVDVNLNWFELEKK